MATLFQQKKKYLCLLFFCEIMINHCQDYSKKDFSWFRKFKVEGIQKTKDKRSGHKVEKNEKKQAFRVVYAGYCISS
jgi:hypothetical protein